jgi:hypothetical protein
VLLRISLFFLHSTALLALLPLVARSLRGGGAGTFTLLLASMGAGAIVATAFLPPLRRTYGRDALVLRGSLLQSAAMAVVAFAPGCLGGRAGHVCRGHGLDHHRQHAQRVGPDGPARLGARARHVDVPDGHHGRQRPGRCAVGAGRHGQQRAGQPVHRRRHRRAHHVGGEPPACHTTGSRKT